MPGLSAAHPFFDVILADNPVGIIVLEAVYDTDGLFLDFRFRYVNPAGGRMLGQSPDQLTNQLLHEVIADVDSRPYWRLYKQVLETGETLHLTDTRYEVDGVSTWFDLLVNRIDKSVLVRCTDVTARQHSQATSASTTTILVDVLDTVNESICVLEPVSDKAGTIVDFSYRFANEPYAQYWAESNNVLIGSRFKNSVHHHAWPDLFDALTQVVDTGQPYQTDYSVGEPGHLRWYTLQASRMQRGPVVLTLRDISERKARELFEIEQNQSLQKAVANLERSNQDLAQFAQVASHDLQEPLRKIQVFSDILQNQLADSLSEGERDMAQRLQLSAKRMQQMIRDLLNYSRLSSDEATFEPTSLQKVVADVCTDLDMLLQDKQADVSVGELPVVQGNASRLRQLFQNLLANALKFQPPGQIPRIQIASELAPPDQLPEALKPGRPYSRITVTDNGIGMDVERYRNKLFRLFQRLHERRSYSGTGIGLAVALRVAESHGGFIDVASTPGEGSTFSVYLPS